MRIALQVYGHHVEEHDALLSPVVVVAVEVSLILDNLYGIPGPLIRKLRVHGCPHAVDSLEDAILRVLIQLQRLFGRDQSLLQPVQLHVEARLDAQDRALLAPVAQLCESSGRLLGGLKRLPGVPARELYRQLRLQRDRFGSSRLHPLELRRAIAGDLLRPVIEPGCTKYLDNQVKRGGLPRRATLLLPSQVESFLCKRVTLLRLACFHAPGGDALQLEDLCPYIVQALPETQSFLSGTDPAIKSPRVHPRSGHSVQRHGLALHEASSLEEFQSLLASIKGCVEALRRVACAAVASPDVHVQLHEQRLALQALRHSTAHRGEGLLRLRGQGERLLASPAASVRSLGLRKSQEHGGLPATVARLFEFGTLLRG
mmetsp:Transcript_124737/g.311998  ORF Transcript_124737/g.311998 Transcript_124737/m.311998 type:complete len:372 (-) Transcript_124737:153-1268(-)